MGMRVCIINIWKGKTSATVIEFHTNEHMIKSELFDKFETGLYTADEFRTRKQKREDEITALTHEMKTLENKKTAPFKVTTGDLKDAIQNGSPKEVNDLLRILIDHIDYARKEKKGEPVFTLYFR